LETWMTTGDLAFRAASMTALAVEELKNRKITNEEHKSFA
jgi:hypothetical protein